MRFQFKKMQDPDNEFSTSTVIVESSAVTIDKVLEDFEDFLRGCGYYFKGNLEIVEDDINETRDDRF